MFDFVKTNVQLQSASGATARSVIRDTLRGQGVRGLYAGLAPTLVGVMPEKALKLGVNDYLRDLFCGYDRSQETLLNQASPTACARLSSLGCVFTPMPAVSGCRRRAAGHRAGHGDKPDGDRQAADAERGAREPHHHPLDLESTLGAPLRSSATIVFSPPVLRPRQRW